MPGIIVNCGRYTERFVDAIRAQLPRERVIAWPDSSDEGADVLTTLASPPKDAPPAFLRSVRWVHVMGAGVDGFPFELLGDRPLTCSKGAAAIPIAEYVLATMLAFEKRLPEEWLRERPATWNEPQTGNVGGLAGATLGLVGMGGIAARVAALAIAFDMTVVAHRRSARPS